MHDISKLLDLKLLLLSVTLQPRYELLKGITR